MLKVAVVFLLLSMCGAAGADPVVRSTDLYPSGGKVVFEAPVDPATQSFSIDLPGAFVPESVRVLNSGGVENLSVNVLLREPWVPSGLSELKALLDSREAELSRLKGRVAALEQTRRMLTLPSSLKDFSAKELILYIEDAQSLRTTVENEMIGLNEGLKKLAEERDRLLNEYDAKSPYNGESLVRVSGRLFSPGPALIEAFTPAAAWRLRYSMDLNSETGDIDAKMYASVNQSTGLALTGGFVFHTKRPSDSVQPPNVQALIVDFEQKESRSYDRAMPAPMMAASNMRQAPVEEELTRKSRMDSEPEMASTLSDMAVRGDGTVTGDDVPVDVVLGRFSLKSVPTLVLIPEQRNEGWIVASMDSIPAPMMPGHADLLVDGQPSGRTLVPEYGLGQTRLPFGMAVRLSAKKTSLVGKTGSSFFGGSGIFRDGYEIEITSGLEVEREISVLDRLPVPVNEKIKLDNVKMTPEPTERDAKNRLTWKMTLKPGEVRKIVVEYTLTYPSGETLTYR